MSNWLSRAGWAGLLLASSVAFGAAPAAELQAPLAVRNTQPLAQLFGLPRARGARLGTSAVRVRAQFDLTSNFDAASAAGDLAYYDGETYVSSLTVERGFGRWEVGLELPHVRHSGGFLDGFIDGFHDVFGFPDSGRSEVPRDLLDYRVALAGEPLVQLARARSDIGDVRGWLGYQLHGSAHSALAVRGMLKLPTGSVTSLSGSGATDVAVWAEYANSELLRGLRLGLSLMAGAVYLGEGDLAPGRQRDLAGVFHFGLQLPLGNRVRLHGQLDAHTELMDARVRQLGGAALQGTLGGRIRLGQRWWLDLGVVENLTTSSAPDVTFQVVLGARFR